MDQTEILLKLLLLILGVISLSYFAPLLCGIPSASFGLFGVCIVISWLMVVSVGKDWG